MTRTTAKRVIVGVTIDMSHQLMAGFPEVLAADGWDVHVVSGPGKNSDRLAALPGVTAHAISMRRDPSVTNDLRSLYEWARLIAKVRPSAISVGTPKAGFLGTLAAFLLRVPVRIYLLRGLRVETTTGARRFILSSIERLTMICSTEVLAISPSLARRVTELRLGSARKIKVLGSGSSNGVDTVEYAPGRFSDAELDEFRRSLDLRENVPTIGFVGRLARDKGLADLADALGILTEREVEWQLLVVGGSDDGSGVDALKKLAEFGPKVVLAGHVDRPARHVALMDVLCLPTLREGFGNVVIEASASGVPVVVSNAVGVVDAVRNGVTGLVAPVGNPTALADQLEKLLLDPAYARQLGAQGREWAVSTFERSVVQAAYLANLNARYAAIESPRRAKSGS